MEENFENQSLEGGSGQQIESSNVELLMKSMAYLRQHQLLLEERIGILPPRRNSGSTCHTSNQGDLIMPTRNQNQPRQLLQQYLKLASEEFSGSPPYPEKAEEWLQNAEYILEHVSNDRLHRSSWLPLCLRSITGLVEGSNGSGGWNNDLE
ncbi:hypothetical protein MKW92_005689 [Papaver armeniacum]|nr:hypothetical protein MKW92_005689 [Papaver armeniacum]